MTRTWVEGEWTVSGYRAMEAIESRIRATRQWVAGIERFLADEGKLAEQQVDSRYASYRRWRHVNDELPLIAWATALSFCFSALERFLADVIAELAELYGMPAPEIRRGRPKIEHLLETLASLGVNARIPDRAWVDLRAARLIRNTLIHELRLDAETLQNELGLEIVRGRGGEPQPTPALVGRSLTAIETVVASVDQAVMRAEERRLAGLSDLSGPRGRGTLGWPVDAS